MANSRCINCGVYLSLTIKKIVNIGSEEDGASSFQTIAQNQEEVPEKHLLLKLLLSQLKLKTTKLPNALKTAVSM